MLRKCWREIKGLLNFPLASSFQNTKTSQIKGSFYVYIETSGRSRSVYFWLVFAKYKVTQGTLYRFVALVHKYVGIH